MQVYRSLASVGSAAAGCAVAIGNFDGVHLGHRRLFELAREPAASRPAPVVALTFDPHPVRVLRPALAPPVLTPLGRKLELLEAAGLDVAVVQPFDGAYAATPAEGFVARDVHGYLGAADVVVGPDFTAGRDRARVDRLRSLLEARGIALTVADPVTADGLVVSSTKVREFLLEGNVDGAALLLGRPHDVEGEVERGDARGRGLGFATANVRAEGLLPANGVYVVRARAAAGVYGGVCNVGVKPTFQGGGPVVAEAHLLDFVGGDLYGQRVRLAFLARLRDERRFPSAAALVAQIAEDARRAREVLGASS